MFENDTIRYVFFLIVVAIMLWAVRLLLKGWVGVPAGDPQSATDVDDEGVDLGHLHEVSMDIDASHDDIVSHDAYTQQELHEPIPDARMARSESVAPQYQNQRIAERIRKDSQAIDSAARQPSRHSRPHRNSRPARARKIQL